MPHFLDGPARGTDVNTARAPIFLRAVQAPDGTWDALDQLTDTPRHEETIHVYRRVTKPFFAHVDGTDKNGRRFGRWMMFADYTHHHPQPPDAVARDTTEWRAWANDPARNAEL
jgi:hypothetical protein